MLSAVPADYTRVSPDWFGTVAAASTSVFGSGQGGASAILSVGESAESTASSVSASDPQQWIVRFSEQSLRAITGLSHAVEAIERSMSGFRVLAGLGLPGQLLLETTTPLSNALAALSGRGDLIYFEPSHMISIGATTDATPNDPRFGSLYGLHNVGQSGGTVDADIDATEAWQISTGSENVIVAVIDTGIDHTHPDLIDNIWVNPGETAGNGIDDDGNGFIDDVHGYDFVNDDGDPFDDEGHGTHVAGTIGATGNNGTGVVGVSWDVSLMGLKFLDADGSGSTADAVRAINYATMMRNQYGHNIRVTNNSWGGAGSSAALRDAIEAGGEADILFVAAAGNSGTDNDASPHYPSSYASNAILAVAATDRNDALASFSCFGATSVDLAAPGVGIVSTVPGAGYASYSGTSMATPHVAGAAALAVAVDPTLTVAELRAAILDTVDVKSGLTDLMVTGGRLNVARMLESLSSEPTVPAAPRGVSASDGTVLGGVQIVWSSALHAESYDIWRGTSADVSAASQLVGGLTTSSYTDTSAMVGTTYHYWVKATNALGTSEFSLSDAGFHLASRSPNDFFADRLQLTGSAVTVSGTNLDATAEVGEPINFYGGRSVWWTWTAPSDGSVVIDTVGSDFDTTLAMYRGATLTTLTRLTRNDDAVGLQSRVVLDVQEGITYQIAVDGYDKAVGAIVLNLQHTAAPEPQQGLLVTGIVHDHDGVSVVFNQPLDRAQLDLHGRNRPVDEIDVLVADSTGMAMDGALVVNTAGDGFRFVVGDGTLAPGDYSLRIRSGETGVVSAAGLLLDGNGDGTVGDAYVGSFTVPSLPVGTAIVGLPGVFQEAGGEVNVSGTSRGGIPLMVSADAGVMAIEMELFYDPDLLTVTGIDLADGLPAGATTLINVLSPGHAIIGFFTPVALGDGTHVFGQLRASVPVTAESGRSHLLDIRTISINEGGMPAVDDDGVHVVAAGNRPPEVVILSANGIEENAAAGTTVGILSAIDPDFGDVFTYALAAGEGDSGNGLFAIAGDRLVTREPVDFEAQSGYSVRVRATDARGESVEQVFSIDVLNVVETFIVTGVSVVDNRLDLTFSHVVDAAPLNLFNALDLLGSADLSVVGHNSGQVVGSLLVTETGLSFVASQPMVADTYELRLVSGESGFRTPDGQLLDGDRDEVPGGDFTETFTVAPKPAVQVGLRSFARAAGEVVNLPVTTAAGIPLELDSTGDVTSLRLVVIHDGALFDAYGVDLAAGLPIDASIDVQEEGTGRLVIEVTSATPLPAGRLTLAHLRGAVPSTAPLGADALFTIGEVEANNGLIPAGGLSAVQVVARLGDTTADGSLSAVDGGLLSRVAMRLDSGFAAYPRLDPLIVGDVTENATISMLDAAMVTGAAAELGSVVVGPVAPSAPSPTRALLRHNRQARIFELADVSGLVAADDNVLLKQALAGSQAQEQAFATMVAALIQADRMDGDGEADTGSARKVWLNPALAAAFADPGQL
jgi:subtilisin family serine protease